MDQSIEEKPKRYQKTIYPGIFKYVGKNGISYGIDYYAGGKKHREITGPRLGDAQTKLAEKKELAKKGVVINRKITFKQLIEKYKEVQKGERYFEKTKKYYMKILEDFFADTKVYRITPLDIESFKQKRKQTPVRGKSIIQREEVIRDGKTVKEKKIIPTWKPRSDTTVNRELQTLRHILSKAVEWGMLSRNPFDQFNQSIFFEEDRGRVRYLTKDEIKRLLSVSPPYLKNIIKAALLTGLRKSDLLCLRWNNLDLDKGILFYKEQKKRDKLRIKILNSDMVELLMNIKKTSEYLFTDPEGKPLRDVKRSFKTALKKAGIENFRFHDLRHTSASYMVMMGASMKAVQEHLGHTSLAMTEKYSHLSPDFQRIEVERLKGLCDEENQVGKKLVRSEGLTENENQSTTYATA